MFLPHLRGGNTSSLCGPGPQDGPRSLPQAQGLTCHPATPSHRLAPGRGGVLGACSGATQVHPVDPPQGLRCCLWGKPRSPLSPCSPGAGPSACPEPGGWPCLCPAEGDPETDSHILSSRPGRVSTGQRVGAELVSNRKREGDALVPRCLATEVLPHGPGARRCRAAGALPRASVPAAPLRAVLRGFACGTSGAGQDRVSPRACGSGRALGLPSGRSELSPSGLPVGPRVRLDPGHGGTVGAGPRGGTLVTRGTLPFLGVVTASSRVCGSPRLPLATRGQ